jgi:pyridoxal phosphate enzyme (YggS family)
MSHIENFVTLKKKILNLNPDVNILVVSKNQTMDKLKPLINLKQIHFGENKVQEAKLKWSNIKEDFVDLNLHFIGNLQSNKAKEAFEIFDYIHSLDNEKLAKIFKQLESNSFKKIKYFIQVNLGNEEQKSGIKIEHTDEFIKFCSLDLKLNVIGLMCIPPVSANAVESFKKLAEVAKKNNLIELSMGMSNDYEDAIKHGSTYVRIGSKIFNGEITE